MLFRPAPLSGVYLIELEPHVDERGFFARLFCVDEVRGQGLESEVIQINDSLSRWAGTLRGMHYQLPPAAEVKIVRCLRGALFDVIVDLRWETASFGQWFGVELNEDNRRMLYVPRGFAHGFLTLRDDTEAIYLVSERHSPEHERGIRWDDPRFGIKWPMTPTVISDKDRLHRDFDPVWHLGLS